MTPRSEINLKARQEARQFARFLALGGCAALVNWLSRFPLSGLWRSRPPSLWPT